MWTAIPVGLIVKRARRGLGSLSGVVLIAAAAVIVAGCATPSEPYRTGSTIDGGVLVATDQLVKPAGETVEFAGRPVDIVLSPDGTRLYAKDDRGLVVVDVASWTVAQELAFRDGLGGSMHGIAVSRDGMTIYATTATDRLEIARAGSDGLLEWAESIELPGPNGDDASHPAGIALDEAKDLAYVCLSRNNSLAVVNLADETIDSEIPVGVAPYDVEIAPDGIAYVSNWGGRHPEDGEPTADSSGTETLVDERGVASSGTVSRVNLTERREIAQAETGLHPSDLVMSQNGERLFVANANSDTVSVFDTPAFELAATISTRPQAGLPFGSMPNALALDEAADTLYVANGGNNAVAVVSIAGEDFGTIRGQIPAGWFPGALAMGEGALFVANVKGIGSRSPREDRDGWNVHWHRGSLSKVVAPDANALEAYTETAAVDLRAQAILRGFTVGEADAPPAPVPAWLGGPSVFEHVVYVIKENRTYDQIFGDIPKGNGDPSLCIFPREITPNHHALAEEFVLLDNYYCNGVNSADGHSWSTEGNVTDHLEKAFGGFTRSYTFGDDPLTYSSSGFIWDNVLGAGLSFRNYGEFNYSEPIPKDATFDEIYLDHLMGTGLIGFTHSIGIDRLRTHSSPDYPGWNMKIPDVARMGIFLSEFAQFEADGNFPNFTIVFLPQDHTTGTTPGAPTPRAHMADNDLALGRLVEALSKSSYWPKTCIFVIEDDPQDGFDHVDGHRSICLVISPYSRRGEVVSTFYNQTSVLHTISRILGVAPMNQMDARSAVMTDCFTDTPDFSPYTARPANIPLDEANPPREALEGKALHWAEKSLAEPFEKFDMADEDTLNRILWFAMKGGEEAYPVEWAGAHGRGLPALNLVLDGRED